MQVARSDVVLPSVLEQVLRGRAGAAGCGGAGARPVAAGADEESRRIAGGDGDGSHRPVAQRREPGVGLPTREHAVGAHELAFGAHPDAAAAAGIGDGDALGRARCGQLRKGHPSAGRFVAPENAPAETAGREARRTLPSRQGDNCFDRRLRQRRPSRGRPRAWQMPACRRVDPRLDGQDQARGASLELGATGQLHAVALQQRVQRGGQLACLGKGRLVDQHRDDLEAARQRGLDLEPDHVARVLQPTAVAPPAWADQHDLHPAAGDRLRDDAPEVLAGPDLVQVEEDGVAAKGVGQARDDAAADQLRVVASIGDEDACHGDSCGAALRPGKVVAELLQRG